MQVKTTMGYHLTDKNGHHLKSLQMINAGDRVGEKREPSYTVGRNVTWCGYYGRKYGDFSKNIKTALPYDPAVPLLGT